MSKEVKVVFDEEQLEAFNEMRADVSKEINVNLKLQPFAQKLIFDAVEKHQLRKTLERMEHAAAN